jgi:hypothetical protein
MTHPPVCRVQARSCAIVASTLWLSKFTPHCWISPTCEMHPVPRGTSRFYRPKGVQAYNFWGLNRILEGSGAISFF